MLFVTFGASSDADPYGTDPAGHWFTYRNIDDDKLSYTVPLPEFTDTSMWGELSYSKTAKQITIPAGKKISLWKNTRDWVKDWPSINFTHVKMNCKSKSGVDSTGYCFSHFYNPPLGSIAAFDMKWGASSPLGEFRWFYMEGQKLDAQTPSLNLELQNNGDHSLTFELPEITFYVEPYRVFDNTQTNKLSKHSNVKQITATIKNQDKITLQTISLTNPHPFPAKFRKWYEMDFIDSQTRYGMLPIIANKTHIIGYDLLTDDFLDVWRIGDNWYKDTKETSFRISCQARTASGFHISYYVIEYQSTCYEDALERWHQEFPEIYDVQPYGIGAMIPHHDLSICFPNTTEDHDLFLANFQWTSWPDDCKDYMPMFYFMEPTIIHVDMPYIADAAKMRAFLENPEYPEGSGRSEVAKGRLRAKSAAILDSTAYFRDGSWRITPESAAWNNGFRSMVMFDKGSLTYDYFIDTLAQIRSNGKTTRVLDGLHFDYYSWPNVSFPVGDGANIVPDTVPYYLLEDGLDFAPMVPAPANHFQHFHSFQEQSKKGFSLNTVWALPQWTKHIAVAGGESFLVKSDGRIEYTHYIQMQLWKLRFNLGSRPISHIEATPKKWINDRFDEVFSIHFSCGGVPSFYDYYESKNFWVDCDTIEATRPNFERWSPTVKRVLNNTVYFANSRGRVAMDFPADEQNPEYLAGQEFKEIPDLSTFCDSKADNHGLAWCFTNVFIGYTPSHSVGDKFVRRAHLAFDIEGQPQCIFTSSYMTCGVTAKNATVTLKGVPSGRAYRIATLRWQVRLSGKEDGSGLVETADQPEDQYSFNGSSIETTPGGKGGKGGKNTAGIVVGTIVAVLVVAAAAVAGVYIYRKKQDEQASGITGMSLGA